MQRRTPSLQRGAEYCRASRDQAEADIRVYSDWRLLFPVYTTIFLLAVIGKVVLEPRTNFTLLGFGAPISLPKQGLPNHAL
jgi:hypothetical protein